MSNKKIPTAEDLFWNEYSERIPDLILDDKEKRHQFLMKLFCSFGKEFAILHKNAALEAAAEEACVTDDSWASLQEGTFIQIDKKSILSAYPDELIK